MTKKEDGESAFPGPGEYYSISGMSLRAWFAGMSLQGIRSQHLTQGYPSETAARWALQDADAMIAALKKSND